LNYLAYVPVSSKHCLELLRGIHPSTEVLAREGRVPKDEEAVPVAKNFEELIFLGAIDREVCGLVNPPIVWLLHN
jgi:hypothetical protein